MKLIHADHTRRYDIPGVAEPAHRPVDVDASITGFTRLRSLRLYRFNAGSIVDGHAEEDEVFVVVISGTAQMEIGWDDATPNSVGTFTLSSFADAGEHASVAYLPPQSVYRLTPHTEVEVAYARATPDVEMDSRVFRTVAQDDRVGTSVLLDEHAHAQHLRLKLVRVSTDPSETALNLHEGESAAAETLIHLQSASGDTIGVLANGATDPVAINAWDTIALSPGEAAILRVPPKTSFHSLTVWAE